MGNEENGREKNTLVDFLYKDMSLINSFYSQIFQGTITNITKSEISADTTAREGKFNIGLLGGKISSNEAENECKTSNINPMDIMILDLIEALNIENVKEDLQDTQAGSIVAIKGSLIFRDYKVINDLIPLVSQSQLIPEFNQPITPNAKGKMKNFTFGKLMEKIISIMPFGLEFEIITKRREQITAIIKDEYLTIKPNDIIRAYGSLLPLEWTIIGIIDEKPKSVYKSKSQFKSAIDDMTNYYYKAINEGSGDYVIKPIVIYRKI